MGTDEIESLFHISKSSKKFGHVIEQNGASRITQGSKGLGFLAAFKFGDEVQWTTRKGGMQSTFSLKKSDLVSKQDLAGTSIPIITEAHNGKGTTIIISSSPKDIEVLLDDLSNETVSEKLAAERTKGNAFPNDFRRDNYCADLQKKYAEATKEEQEVSHGLGDE